MKSAFYVLSMATLLAGVASAQFAGPPPGGPHSHGGFGPGGFGPGMHPGKVVTGAPYTATATDTFTQKLADGNTIQRTTTATVARDNSGRTYAQQTINAGPLATNGPVTLTFINDPVAGYAYVLNPATKTATRRQLHAPPAGGNAAGPRGWMNGSKPVNPNPNVAQTDLGTQSMNGVTVHGNKIVHTVPAGTVGNAQAITATSETWTSSDLQVVVSAKRDDPRTGTSTYALTNIQRVEPSATMFQVPSDYTIQDAKRGPGAWGSQQ